MQSSIVWCVAGASQFHKPQQVPVITLNANVGIKIMWAPNKAVCARCSVMHVRNSSGRKVTDTKSVNPVLYVQSGICVTFNLLYSLTLLLLSVIVFSMLYSFTYMMQDCYVRNTEGHSLM